MDHIDILPTTADNLQSQKETQKLSAPSLNSRIKPTKCLNKIIGIINKMFISKYIFVENNKIETSLSNYIFGLTFQSLSSK